MPKYFEYSHLQSDIHRFQWLSNSGDSASEYYDFIIQVYDNLPEKNGVIRILHDYQHLSFTPLAKIFPKIKSLQLMYPDLERRIAYLSNDNLTETLVKSMISTVNRTGNRKFFKLEEEELAIKWLLL